MKLSIRWTADDPLAGVAKASVQWRSGSSWRTIASKERDGPGAMLVNVSALPGGAQPLRLAISKRTSNVAVRWATVRLTGNGGGTTAAVPLVRFRDARLVLAVERARVERTGGRTTLVRRVPSEAGA